MTLGVHSLDHFALTVPDLEEACRFYAAFGLSVRAEGDSAGIYTRGSSHRWGQLAEGRKKRLHHLSFGVFERDLERFRALTERLGVSRLDPPPGVESAGIWIRDPDGTLIELTVAEKSSPNEKPVTEFASSPAGIAGAPKRSAAPQVSPSRLGHCLIFTRNIDETVAFYTQVLGLALSDRCGNAIAFMHGIHGSAHHLIAFARSEAPGLHHSSWDVSSLDEIGLGAIQMAQRGYSDGWGLGRHVLGSNYFHYVRDPWASYCEYSCDMDYIPADGRWEARDHAPEDAFYVWGPKPPDTWTHNYEADQG